MPSAPKKTTAATNTATATGGGGSVAGKKKPTLSLEEQALVVKQRREAIEKRLLRLQAKIEKDRALLQKYTVPLPIAEETEGAVVE